MPFLCLGSRGGAFHAELERQQRVALGQLSRWADDQRVRVTDGWGGCTVITAVDGLGERAPFWETTVAEARAVVRGASARVRRVREGGLLFRFSPC